MLTFFENNDIGEWKHETINFSTKKSIVKERKFNQPFMCRNFNKGSTSKSNVDNGNMKL